MHVLSRHEEEKLLTKLKKNALATCDPEVREFAECATGRVVSVVWACRVKLKMMNACLHKYTTEEELDKLRLKYIEESRNTQ